MSCTDKKVWLCFAKCICWLTDHIENSKIYGVINNYCPACICPTEELGEYCDMGYPYCSHAIMRGLWPTVNVHKRIFVLKRSYTSDPYTVEFGNSKCI